MKAQKYNLPTGETVWLVPVIEQGGGVAFTIEDEMNFFTRWSVGDMLQMIDHGNGNWDIRCMSTSGSIPVSQSQVSPQPSQEPQPQVSPQPSQELQAQKSFDSMSEDELECMKREFLKQLKSDLT
jgi:hypothetical protein